MSNTSFEELGPARATPANRLVELTGTRLTVDEALVGRRAVLSVAGEIDVTTAAAVREAIEWAATRAFEIWLDLTATTFMDSSGLHAVATARTRLAEADCRLVVICPAGPVLRVLTLTGFDQVLEIHPSRRAAHDATT
jgi:anti-sigma B factor antagonist